MKPIWYFENLTVRAWFFHIFPGLVRARLRGQPVTRALALDGSTVAVGLASCMSWIAGTSVRRVQFRGMDVRDENGTSTWLRVAYRDIAELKEKIVSEELFQEFVKDCASDDLFPFYAEKVLSIEDLNDRYTLTRALLVIRYCAWAKNEEASDEVTVCLERRPWLKNLRHFGAMLGIAVASVGRSPNVRDFLLYVLSPGAIAAVRSLISPQWRKRALQPADSPVIGVQHYGQLNIDRPEYYSDLFFAQNSAIAGKDLLMLFGMPHAPVDRDTWNELSRHDINGIALDPRATQTPEVPAFVSEVQLFRGIAQRLMLNLDSSSSEQKWFKEQFFNYNERRRYWKHVFERHNVGIHVTWYNVDGEHVAIADALKELNGVSAIYQRSLEVVPDSELAIAADLFFGFSHDSVECVSRNGSQIGYSVVTGYLGDHRFPLLHGEAAQVRANLQKRGAEHIVAFFDENSTDDERWQIGHSQPRESYAFLLEKVLEHSWFGLVLKPKVHTTLRTRLGPVAELLSRALATGRCYIFEGGPLQSKYPPAVAALASDVAVHDHLCSGTAGVEAALAGVPTLLLDRENFGVSPLYELGVGRVVFNDWKDLWETYLKHSRSHAAPEGFGDWSPMLDRLDPFRDGHAAQRMGQYLQWTLDGLKEGRGRETALADAAERYCDRWGYDKVRSGQSLPATLGARA